MHFLNPKSFVQSEPTTELDPRPPTS